ncbi:MAG: serine/threonine protein kinase [Polyangiaceae bacterium]|nr:serine/threonine protein kinase [Polyangiaceae bacterium]
MTEPSAPRLLGRYAIHEELASGGMATVHLGRLLGPAGFSRTVAIKRLHPQFAKDPEFVAMFLDEARLAVRIQHPNVVQTLDVVAQEGELFIVMEYLHGATVGQLLRAHQKPVDPAIAVSIASAALHGLHAAHEAKSDRGEPLGIIHRDISPQNLFVGRDGVTHVLDFGVAKAAGRFHTTEEGQVKGKLPYMAPEQIRSEPLSSRTDVYSASVVLWELLVARRFITGQNPGAVIERVLFGNADAPSKRAQSVPRVLDGIVLKGLSKDPAERFGSAREMALELERAVRPALASEVGAWVETVLGAELDRRAERVARIESGSDSSGMSSLLAEIVTPSGSAAAEAPAAASTAQPAGDLRSSSVSAQLSAPILVAAPARPTRTWLLAASALALLGVGFGLSRLLTSSESPSPAASEASVAAPAASSSAPAEPARIASAVARDDAPPPGPVTVPDAGSEGGPPPSDKKPPATSRPPAKPRANCDPPWTLDQDGRKRYKMDCL